MDFSQMTKTQLLQVDVESLSPQDKGAWLARWDELDAAGKAQTPAVELTPQVDQLGNVWGYDPATGTNRQLGKAQLITRADGSKVWYDPLTKATSEFSAAREPSPSAQATAAKLEMEPGSIDWVGYVPTRQWSAGGTYNNLSSYPEAQASLLDQKIADLQTQRAQVAAYMQQPLSADARAEEANALRRIDRDLAGYAQARQAIGRQLKEPGYGGSSSGDTIAEINARAMAAAQQQIAVLAWQKANGLIEDAEAERQAKAIIDQAAENARQEHAIALAQEQARLRGEEAATAWGRELPFRQAAEARAQAAEARAQQQMRLQGAQVQSGAYARQAEAGMGMVNQATGLGVSVTPGEYNALYFDPHKRALQVLEQAMTAPDFDPQQRALQVLGQAMQPAQPQQPAPMGAPQLPGVTPRAPSVY